MSERDGCDLLGTSMRPSIGCGKRSRQAHTTGIHQVTIGRSMRGNNKRPGQVVYGRRQKPSASRADNVFTPHTVVDETRSTFHNVDAGKTFQPLRSSPQLRPTTVEIEQETLATTPSIRVCIHAHISACEGEQRPLSSLLSITYGTSNRMMHRRSLTPGK